MFSAHSRRRVKHLVTGQDDDDDDAAYRASTVNHSPEPRVTANPFHFDLATVSNTLPGGVQAGDYALIKLILAKSDNPGTAVDFHPPWVTAGDTAPSGMFFNVSGPKPNTNRKQVVSFQAKLSPASANAPKLYPYNIILFATDKATETPIVLDPKGMNNG